MQTNKAQALNHIQAWGEDSARKARVEFDGHPMNETWRKDASKMALIAIHIEHGDLSLAIEAIREYQANPPETYTDEGKANFYKNMQWCIDLLEYPELEFIGWSHPVNKTAKYPI